MLNPQKHVRLFLRIGQCALVSALLFCSGCGHEQKSSSDNTSQNSAKQQDHEAADSKSLVVSHNEDTVTVRLDALGEERTYQRRPQRVVILSGSLLELWYLAGGKVVGRATQRHSLPEAAKDVPVLGTFMNPDVEQLVALEPDLVISAATRAARSLDKFLSKTDIPHLIIDYDTYTAFHKTLSLYGMLLGDADKSDALSKQVARKVDKIMHKYDNRDDVLAAVVFSSSRSLSLQLPDSSVGQMLTMLGADNVGANARSTKGRTLAEFSFESFIASDPDVIFFNLMGNVKDARELIKEQLSRHPAWQDLKAVKNDRVHYLDKELFLYKANDDYPEAFQTLATYLYPEESAVSD